MRNSRERFRTEPIPKARRWAFDAGYMGRRTHIIHGLLEVDVTEPLAIIAHHRRLTGEKISFTAFIINCLAQAIDDNPHAHAYRDWRDRLVIFEDVHINCMVEVQMKGKKVPMPHIFKAVNKRPLREIHEEMRATQSKPLQTREARFMDRFLLLPGFLRHLFYRIVMRMPHTMRQNSSPVMVTAVGMFGKGTTAWGIPMANFTLTITLGPVAKKPGVFNDQITIREYLHMTVSIDHDIVDGAPAARFVQELRELIECGFGLKEID